LASCEGKVVGKILHWLTVFSGQVTSQLWRHFY